MKTELIALLLSIAHAHGVPPRIMTRIAAVECNYNLRCPDSRKGAQGWLQLMPAMQRHYGVTDPYGPRESATAAARYLRSLRRRLGSWRLAVGGYGCGPARAHRCEAYVAKVMR